MVEPARHVWGHCLAVLRDPGAAEEAATLAARQGGQSRTSMLAHARSRSLELAETTAPPPQPDLDAALDPAIDLVELAGLLAATRPAVERAVVDLDARLDRGRLGRALGLPPAQAAARAGATAQTWEQELDPALLAWLGPGECPDLAQLLAAPDSSPPADEETANTATTAADNATTLPETASTVGRTATTLGRLLTLAGPVGAHVDGCQLCWDRRRGMVSVRSLQAQVPTPEVPGRVRVAAARGWFRIPAPLPPSVDAAAGRSRRAALLLSVGAATIIVGGGVATLAWWQNGRASRQSGLSAGAALAALPGNGNALLLTPALVPANGIVTLRNTSPRTLSWQATPSATWVAVNPAAGTLGPGQAVSLGVYPAANAPPGGVRATVAVAGSDGSAAAADLTGPASQPLDVSAAVAGCNVRVQVVDQVDAVVVLRYQVGSDVEHSATMSEDTNGAGRYTATLPTEVDPLTWWVTVTDGAGGSARTADQLLAPGSCLSG